MAYSCSAPIVNVDHIKSNCVDNSLAVESEKVLRRLHQINENLASIRGQLREFEERILGDGSSSNTGASCAPTPNPRPVFIDQVNHIINDSDDYIGDIRATLNKLRRF